MIQWNRDFNSTKQIVCRIITQIVLSLQKTKFKVKSTFKSNNFATHLSYFFDIFDEFDIIDSIKKRFVWNVRLLWDDLFLIFCLFYLCIMIYDLYSMKVVISY